MSAPPTLSGQRNRCDFYVPKEREMFVQSHKSLLSSEELPFNTCKLRAVAGVRLASLDLFDEHYR
jgi:hypothetical protein